ALAGAPNQVEREGDAPVPETNRLMVPAISVDAAYFRALGLPLASGRSFDGSGDRAGAREVVVNERLAHVLFPKGDAIGRRLRVAPQQAKDAPLRTIVGIAPDLRQAPGSAPDPIVYLPFDASLPARPALFIRTAGDPAALAPLVREQVQGADPDLPIVALQTARQAERGAGWNAPASPHIIRTIPFIAVTLAAVGLYAVTAYGVARRTREIGIRVALGAQPGRLLWLVARGTLVRLAAGLMAGLVMMNLWGRAFGGPGAGFDPGNMLSIV